MSSSRSLANRLAFLSSASETLGLGVGLGDVIVDTGVDIAIVVSSTLGCNRSLGNLSWMHQNFFCHNWQLRDLWYVIWGIELMWIHSNVSEIFGAFSYNKKDLQHWSHNRRLSEAFEFETRSLWGSLSSRFRTSQFASLPVSSWIWNQLSGRNSWWWFLVFIVHDEPVTIVGTQVIVLIPNI